MKPFFTEEELAEIRRADMDMDGRRKKRGRPPGARNYRLRMMTPEEIEQREAEQKAHRREYARTYYRNNKEKMLEYSREYYRKHHQQYQRYQKTYTPDYEKKREYSKKYYQEHTAEILERQRQRREAYRLKNAEKIEAERQAKMAKAKRDKKARRIAFLEIRIKELTDERDALMKEMEDKNER